MAAERVELPASPFFLDKMDLSDLEEVAEIEREAYSLPWPSSAYRKELRENRMAYYVVIRRGERLAQPEPTPRRPFPFSLLPQAPRPQFIYPRPNLIGHGGLWMMLDEAHITTIAVRNDYRGQGMGELVFAGLIDHAYDVNAKWVTLEVRVSNVVAQNLYMKYGFHQSGVRPKYYSDNREDAYVMVTDDINTLSYRNFYLKRRRELMTKLALRTGTTPPAWW
jgi:ribosomal-protein-alanine N-acetyltransferase